MSERIITMSPSSGDQLNSWDYMTKNQISLILQNSEKAFKKWRSTPISERSRNILELSKVLQISAPRLAQLASKEMGKPIAQALKEIDKCILTCQFYAENAGLMLERQSIKTENSKSYVSSQPLGPIFSIMPWNFPYWQVIRFALPVLVSGNTIIIKHADITTGCALELQNVFDQSGFPAGVYQTVLANHIQTSEIIRTTQIAGVTLTGSEIAGRRVAEIAGSSLKKHVLELGGSDPYLVLHDADLEFAADVCVQSRLINSGQSCVAAKRFIIVDQVYDEFLEVFIAKFQEYQLGFPEALETKVGPLAKASSCEEILRQVKGSQDLGAKLAYTSIRPEGKGFWQPLMVLTEVVPGMPVFDEEVFGPVAAMTRAANEDVAIDLANHSRFGLGAAVFSRDLDRAESIAETRLDSGLCSVNAMVVSDPRLPFGGIKASGYGRELSDAAIREFTNIKTVVVR